MSYKFRKLLLIVISICVVLYVTLFTFLIFSDLYRTYHIYFILSIIFFVSFWVFIISKQEKNFFLQSSCLLFMILSITEFAIESIESFYEFVTINKIVDIILHSFVGISLTLFGYGLFKEIIKKKRQSHINSSFFENNKVIYIEYITNFKKFYIEFSSFFMKKYGIKRNIIEIGSEDFINYLHPSDRNKIKIFNNIDIYEQVTDIHLQIRFPEMNNYCHLNVNKSFIFNNRYSFIAIDVSTKEGLKQNLLLKTNELYKIGSYMKNYLTKTNEYVAVIHLDGKIIYASNPFTNLYPNKESIINENLFKLNEEYGHTDHSWFNKTIKEKSFQFYTKSENNGTIHWIVWNNSVLLDNKSKVESVMCLGHDVSEIVNLKEKYEFLSYHDSNTGLLNKEGLLDSLDKLNDINSAICFFIDIRNFSTVNDYYGITIGDEIVKKVVEEISNCSNNNNNNNNLLARFNGDQFVLMLLDPSDVEIKYTMNKLSDCILKEYSVNEICVQIKLNIGYADYPNDALDLKQMILLSNLAMKESASSEHNSIVKYDMKFSNKLDEKINMISKLRNAIYNSKIDVYFQNIVDAKTGQIEYIEALARWNDEQLGFVRPDYFIQIAKDSNLIDLLEDYLIEKAISYFAMLKENGNYKNTKLSLNLSPTTFLRNGYDKVLEKLINKYSLKCSDIFIEVSEKTFVHNLNVCNYIINKFKDKGFGIAIDDFGSEYSSLTILDNINYDLIKIDGSFINNINLEKNKIIIDMIIKIASLSNKMIIAEGIETIEESQELLKLNCYLQQGYYFHRPEKLL